jgi:hypothetical protein
LVEKDAENREEPMDDELKDIHAIFYAKGLILRQIKR